MRERFNGMGTVPWKEKYMPLGLVPAVYLLPPSSITTAEEQGLKTPLFSQDGVPNVCSLLAERVVWDHR